MYKTNQENLCIDLLYEITLRIECMNFMIQECIEKQIKRNINKKIEKELLKDFEFYYNQYETLHKYFGNKEKNNYKLTFIKQSLVFNNEFKDNNIIPLIKQAIPFCVSTLKNTTEFPLLKNII